LAKSKNPSGDPSNDTQTNTTNVEALQKKLRKMDAKRKKKTKKVKKCEKDKKAKGKKNKKKKKKKSKKPKKKKKKEVKPPLDSLEEYEDTYASDFFGFMAEFFTTVGRYVPFFGPSKKPPAEEVEEEEEEARGTTPRIESMRKPKKPSYSSEKFYDLTNVDENGNTEEKEATPWYYPSFIYYNDYENEVPATTTESSWLDSWLPWNSWFDDSEPTTEAPADDSWFTSLNLFGSATTTSTTTTTTTTTTTPQPPPVNIPFLTVSNPIKNPEKWLSILAQQLKVTTTTVRPTPEVPDNVPPKPVKVYYDNYQLWRLNPRTKENVDYLDDYRRSPEGQKFKWWRGPSLR
jgi:hypothetical protein